VDRLRAVFLIAQRPSEALPARERLRLLREPGAASVPEGIRPRRGAVKDPNGAYRPDTPGQLRGVTELNYLLKDRVNAVLLLCAQ